MSRHNFKLTLSSAPTSDIVNVNVKACKVKTTNRQLAIGERKLRGKCRDGKVESEEGERERERARQVHGRIGRAGTRRDCRHSRGPERRRRLDYKRLCTRSEGRLRRRSKRTRQQQRQRNTQVTTSHNFKQSSSTRHEDNMSQLQAIFQHKT